ncbi:MAG: DJ-1/PfpI family protein [Nitrospinae bacterium]|nr:DJ-1/PfpI family protein [Nitrospinota bacterium]
MKKVLVPIAPGFEEIETITIVDILRRAGARVTLAGTQEGMLEGSRGIKIEPDALLDSVIDLDFDLICLPGGQPGTDNLKKDARIETLLKRMVKQDKLIATICAAPTILKKAGILENHSMTCHPSVQNEFNSDNYLADRVVVDGNVITSQSPGTAMEFALKLVEILFGSERLKKVNDGVLARI